MHQRANLIRPKSKFDKYEKLSSNLFKTKLLDFYASLKISWMSVLVIPWRKARRLAEFTNTYEVADNFMDRKSDFFYLNRTIVQPFKNFVYKLQVNVLLYNYLDEILHKFEKYISGIEVSHLGNRIRTMAVKTPDP